MHPVGVPYPGPLRLREDIVPSWITQKYLAIDE